MGPTKRKSPTKKPIISSVPTRIPSLAPTHPLTFPDLHFYVMGDIPYSRTEEAILIRQLNKMNDSIKASLDASLFRKCRTCCQRQHAQLCAFN